MIEDMNEGGAKSRTKGAIEAAGDKIRDFLGDDEEERQPANRRGSN